MPTRIIREGILTSEPINRLTERAELFYRKLMNVADDYGRYYSHPSLLRAACYPLRLNSVSEDDVSQMLSECLAVAIIVQYGGKYLQIIKFRQQTRSKSRFPEPSESELLIIRKAEDNQMRSESESESESNTKTYAEARGVVAAALAHFPEIEVPDWNAVKMHATAIGLPEWRALDWFNEMQAVGWKDRNRRDIMAWRPMMATIKSYWERDGRHAQPPSRVSTNGTTTRPMDIKTIIQAKETLAAQLRTRFCSDTAIDSPWSDQVKKQEFFKLKREIKALNQQLSNMAS